MEDVKLCPLLMAGYQDMGIACRGELCAWYIRERCAMADIADTMMDIAMNTAVQD